MRFISPKYRILFYGIAISSALILSLAWRPSLHLWKARSQVQEALPLLPQGYADDISRLNKTAIDSQMQISPDTAIAIAQLRSLLVYARQKQLPISIAGARHSMGGHTIAPSGLYLDMLPFNHMQLDTLDGSLLVGAGALWSEVIPYLNQYGRAVAIMQSDNAFSVGGSLSVNCHGWQHNQPPISSTVHSLRLLTADGKVLHCSRSENEELFSLVLGGYGLFGIILEAKLQTVPNELYSYHRLVMDADKYLDYYSQHIDQNPEVRMVYGRLNVSRDHFLEKAMLNYFVYKSPAPEKSSLPDPGMTGLKRSIFLGSKEDEYGKKLRWNSEQAFTKTLIGSTYTRNQIMNESPALYLNQSPERTDVLHEYFIPRSNFVAFVRQLQQLVPRHQADLLNITIRNVYPDQDSHLRYAHEEVFAFVMFFNQAITPEAEADMQVLTRQLTDAALQLGGTYYLPYRLHQSQEQFDQSYPMGREFFARKRVFDPEERFQNMFYQQYGKPAAGLTVRQEQLAH
jgi:FAD/FMN-containing dehydrogenase